MARKPPREPRRQPEPEAAEPIVADPRPRSRPQLIAAAILYSVCLAALAALGVWG